MSKAKFIQENGETILPITHEEAVLDNNGKNLPSKYQQKQDENLLTDAKTIVGAINELSTKSGDSNLEDIVNKLDNFFALSDTQFTLDANDILNIKGIYRTYFETLNLPSVCYDNTSSSSSYGILITLTQQSGAPWGIQFYCPIDGDYRGATFNRLLWSFNDDGSLEATDWSLPKAHLIETESGTLLTDTLDSTWGWIQDNQDWLNDVAEKVGYDELSTNSQTLTGAINELFQSANNGKELIASAIGEPLSSEDTFSAMSTDINGLLATFKTNMMKNGVAVESGDRFKSLIDKIATLADSEGKYASGSVGFGNWTVPVSNTITIETNLSFTPTYIICFFTDITFAGSTSGTNYNVFLSNGRPFYPNSINNPTNTSNAFISVENISKESFTLKSNKYQYTTNGTTWTTTVTGTCTEWYAIGIGEEDTALRDSLASILGDKGIDVTEEDDMASLIAKVDTELDEATSNKNRLYDLMLEGGYEVNSSMNLDSLLDLLEQSGISVGDIKQIEIACGTNYTFVLKTDGSLWGCGYNNYGQLGLNDTSDRTTFTQVTININNDVKQIACGQSHTIIQKNDGTLWGCGLNSSGQLGLGDTTTRYTFTRIANNINNDVKQIVCGSYHTFIIKNDGSIWACGNNDYGQLGLNTTDKTSFTKVTANINNDVKQIACGQYHTFIIKTDGSLWGCGYNYYNQLGLSDPANKHMFVKITTNINNDVKQIACGDNHTFILKNDGSIWACGRNNYGQLGLNDTSDRTTFTQIAKNINNDVTQVVCGSYHTFIIKNDGSIWGCGNNVRGQLGLNTSNNSIIFTQVPRGF